MKQCSLFTSRNLLNWFLINLNFTCSVVRHTKKSTVCRVVFSKIRQYCNKFLWFIIIIQSFEVPWNCTEYAASRIDRLWSDKDYASDHETHIKFSFLFRNTILLSRPKRIFTIFEELYRVTTLKKFLKQLIRFVILNSINKCKYQKHEINDIFQLKC